MKSDGDRIIIVGAGVAGLRAAERLRELGFDGELVIIGDERRRPYHRPMVSKQLVMGTVRPIDAYLEPYADLDAHWRLGTRALRLDTGQRVVHLPGGEEIWYDGRYLGRDVTLVGHAAAPLYRFGPHIAGSVTRLHRAHRVDLAMKTQVRHWISTKESVGVHLTNNKLVVAGSVVLAIGSVPAVEWLRDSGLTVDDGVLCESTLFAVGGQDIVVAGDIAKWPNLRFDDTPRRVEHWLNAVDSGRAAAENLMAGRDRARPFCPLPRAWSTLYDVRLMMAGMPSLGDDTVALAKDITGFLRAGRLVGLAAWNRPRAMLRWMAELERRLPAPTQVAPVAAAPEHTVRPERPQRTVNRR
jgi:NADPH-dependent 2,4-dienoyl-CoA reductase/sulfur reductase-like enzyme